jgi:hypothetical protein
MNLVLGAGYTGARFLKTNTDFLGTNRTGRHGFITFDANDPNTWVNIAQGEKLLLTFDGAGVEPQWRIALADFLFNRYRSIVMLSSTGLFVENGTPKSPLTELSPLLQSSRNQWELLLESRGANRLLLAGIYGPNRSPLEWLRKGFVSAQKSFVNLIHVEDIVNIAHMVLESNFKGKKWIVFDGEPHRWESIITQAILEKKLPQNYIRPDIPVKRPERFLDNSALIHDFSLKGCFKELKVVNL